MEKIYKHLFFENMKIKQLLLAGVASMTLFSCNDQEDISVSQNEIKSLSVSLGGVETRASTPSDIITSDIKNVNSVLINLTDINGKLSHQNQLPKMKLWILNGTDLLIRQKD